MNQTLLIILIIAVFIYIVLDNCKETFYETFMPHDPSYYIESCKNLTKEKNQVNNLETIFCNKNSNLNSKDTINTNINCKDITSKKIVLTNEQPSWCSFVNPEQRSLIEKEMNSKVPPITHGPIFMETQYNIDGSTIQPFDLKTNNYPSY